MEMPFYEYLCKKCGKQFETLRSMQERDEPAACPHCGSVRAERKLSAFAACVAGPKGSSSTAPCGHSGGG
jgi:putative FmdB family regulatory protein